jgi:arylformamidase
LNKFLIVVKYVVATFVLTTAVSAQDKSAYYSVTHSKEYKIDWKAFYDKIDALTAEARKELPHHLGIPYGSGARQKLDLYLPTEKPSRRPVLIYLHGGAFFEGDRAHYGYVARPLAKHGVLTIVPSYRLAPEFQFPAQPQDVQQVLSWVYHNIATYGGAPDHIYLVGHSSGAILTAYVSMKTDWMLRMSLPADLIKGCVPISANYDLRQRAIMRHYAPTRDIQLEASPIFHVEHPPPRTILALGSMEKSNFLKPSRNFSRAIQRKGGIVETVVVNGLDHDGVAISLGYEKSKLVQAILNMIKVQ